MSGVTPIKHKMKVMIGNKEIACVSGEKIFFDIDTPHGGCSYDILCFRLFMKFGYHEIDEVKEKDPIGFVRTCKYCNFTSDKHSDIYSRMRFCSNNHKGKENRKRKAETRRGKY